VRNGAPCLRACVGQSAMAGVWWCSLRVVCGAASFHCGESCKANEAQRPRPNFAYLEREKGGSRESSAKRNGNERKGKERKRKESKGTLLEGCEGEGSHLLTTLEVILHIMVAFSYLMVTLLL
jgi:hypothetical protein